MSDNGGDEEKKESGGGGGYFNLNSLANFFIVAESLVKIIYNASQLYFAYQTYKSEIPEGPTPSTNNNDNGVNSVRNDNQSPSYPLNPPADIPIADDDDEDRDACKICMSNKIRTVNLPCGHLVFCFRCTRDFITNNFQHNCPICRVRITEIKMIYNM